MRELLLGRYPGPRSERLTRGARSGLCRLGVVECHVDAGFTEGPVGLREVARNPWERIHGSSWA